MPSLDTVEELGILVFRFQRIQVRERHLILLPGFAYADSHEEIEKAVENENKNHISVFSGKQILCCHLQIEGKLRMALRGCEFDLAGVVNLTLYTKFGVV